ncbi:heme ABC transporter ATP-binding protein [Saccharospirillum impatiens]|uniref:heme ABC transporter ATP-binding protein n=1 Tax=Saccharospirillum impatiens TaxID=169438 RepID=UPI000411A610|nr:heme ABC transporter ATP-binding protein [Saccharospirillum impatiens]
MINVAQLSWSIGGRRLLDSISFQLAPGEVVAVIGANGAGKSSLLKVVSGEWPVQQGKLSYDGEPIKGICKQALAKRRAVMPQSSPMNFPFKAWEVVSLGRTPFGLNNSRRERQTALERLELTGTGHLAERYYTALSGGEKQRVQLARVLNQLLSSQADHRYLFLDECTASLDPSHQHQVFQRVQALTDQGIGVLAIVHDIHLAAQYADRVLILKDGALLDSGPVKDCLTPEAMVEAFSLHTHRLNHPEADWPLLVARENPLVAPHIPDIESADVAVG